MNLWTLSLREIQLRPGRTVLTLASITIGTAAVVAISLGTATARHASQQLYEAITGRAALQVVSAGDGDLPEDLVAQLQRVAGVKLAVPSVQRFTRLFARGTAFTMLVMGIDPAREAAVRDYDLCQGRFFDRGGGILLEANVARSAGIQVGDTVQLMTPLPRQSAPLKSVEVVGLLTARGAAGFDAGGTVFLALPFAERHFTGLGRITVVDLVLAAGANEAAVRSSVEQAVPPGVLVRAPGMRTALAHGVFESIEYALQFAGLLTVVLAMFIVCNAFLMNVSERRPQLAILRAVGATRGQIVRLLLVEGLAVGTVGSLLGCLLGWWGGAFLLKATMQLFVTAPPELVLSYKPFLLAMIFGPAASVLAAYLPIHLTRHISPLEAMRPMVGQGGAGRVSRRLALLGVVLSVFSGAAMAASIGRWGLPIWTVIPLGATFMASFVLWIPWLIYPLGPLLSRLMTLVLGIEGELAYRQVQRRPTRTALTIGVLFIAAGTGIGLGTIVINNVDDVRTWYRQILAGDFFVRAILPDVATGRTQKIPAAVGDTIRAMRGVAAVDAVQMLTNVQAEGQPVILIARQFAQRGDFPIALASGVAEDARQGLLLGQVVIGAALAQRLGLHAGDSITLKTQNEGDQRLRIAGLAVDYFVAGAVVYLDRRQAERLFHVEGVDTFIVKAAPESRESVHAALAGVCKERGLLLHSFAEMIRLLDLVMGGVVGGLWGVLLLGFVVAALGVANTLTMNMLEQTRELAMLRVVAMTRWQVRKVVLGQAIIMGIIGLLMGIVAGLITAWNTHLSMVPLLGYSAPFAIQPWLLAGSLAIGMALVLAASLLPAERAARLDLLLALKYE
jgi:putative ABC transport system permease protein